MKLSGMHKQAYVYRGLCREHGHTQACNEALNKANVSKTNCTSSDFGFMRLRREDNRNNKALIDIP